MKKILFTGCTFNNEEINSLRKKDIEIIPASSNLTDDRLKELLKEVDGVICNGEEKYSDNVLNGVENLKFIQFYGIGYNKCVDIETANKYNKIIMNTPKVNSYSVAEFTIGLIFALNQKISLHDSETRKGNWNERMFFDLKDKTIGIIGMGHIGIPFAKILKNGFNANILYYDIEKKQEVENEIGAKKVSLNKLLEESDIVSLHLPLNDSTRNLIGKEEIALMKKHAYLINTARAELVDYNALYNALSNKAIAGAAFDGFYNEPIDLSSEEAKLLSLPVGNFIATPHTGYNAVEADDRLKKMCIDNIEKLYNNEKCNSIVNN